MNFYTDTAGRFFASERNKKLVLASLLTGCLVLLLLIWFARPEPRPVLDNLAVVDTVVLETLDTAGFGDEARSSRIFQPDSLFSRKELRVSVPPETPTTLLHARMARRLHPLGVETRGERYFPENTLRLDFIIYDTIVYTLIFEIKEPEENEVPENDTPDIVPVP